MRRGSIFVLLFVLLAAVVVGISQLLRSQPAQDVLVAVSPLAEAWVRPAAESFNATNPVVNGTQRVQIRLQIIDDTSVWQDSARGFTTTQHPTGWIPALTASIDYAAEARLPFAQLVPSTARTLLVWGVFESRSSAVLSDNAVLDWGRVQAVANAERWDSLPSGETSWGFVKLAFAAPDRSASGLAVLLSGAAAYANSPLLSATVLSDASFRDWLAPVVASVPNFNALGADAAAALIRGPSVGEIALLPESQWLTNLSGMTTRETILLSYPAYPLVFDFPLAVWDSPDTTVEQRQAVQLFSDWLLQPERQAQTVTYGLRPAQQPVDAQAGLFATGIPYGIAYGPALENSVQLPERDAVFRLLAWANTVR